MAESVTKEKFASDFKMLSRQNNLLFIVGGVSVLTGLLLPAAPAIVDLIMIAGMALSAAVIFICFYSRKPAELAGFALAAVITIAFLLTAEIASAKLIITEGAAGLVATFAAKFDLLSRILPAGLSASLFTGISIMLLAATLKSTAKLLRCSRTSLEEISEIEQAKSEFDISFDEYEPEKNTAKEKGFFYATYAFGRLVVWLGVLISSAVVFSLFSIAISGKTSSDVPAKTLISLAGGAGIGLQLVTLSVISAVSHLARKIASQSSREKRMTEEQFQQRVKIIACEVAAAHKNNNGLRRSNDTCLFDCNEFEDETTYDYLINLLVESSSDDKVLLIAAHGSKYAPVTIPVNTAVRLAGAGLKTLIIDFDLKRLSVQRVFETENCDFRAVKTCIENISLISGRRLASSKFQTLEQSFANTVSLYDYIIIYAPDAQIPLYMTELATSVMFFSSDDRANIQMQNVIDDLADTPCRVLTPSSLFQTV